MKTRKAKKIATGLVIGGLLLSAAVATGAPSQGSIEHSSLVHGTAVAGDVSVDWSWIGGKSVASNKTVKILLRAPGEAWSTLASDLPITAGAYPWDTTATADGTYRARLKVVGSPAADTISVTVDNSAPEITITRPGSGQLLVEGETLETAIVAGKTPLAATAFDAASGVEQVVWYLDGEEIATGAETEYDFSMDPGQHILTAEATDAAGNSSSDSTAIIAAPGPSGAENIEPPSGSGDEGEDGDPSAPEIPDGDDDGEEPEAPEAPEPEEPTVPDVLPTP